MPPRATPACRPGIDLTAESLSRLRHSALAPVLSGRVSSRAGTLPGRKPGLGSDIHDLRHFSEGDDPRHLDAAATARSGQPHVRTFHEEEERTTLLLADFRGPMLWGSRTRLRSVAAAEVLAAAGWQIVQAGGSTGVLIVSDAGPRYLPPRPRETSMLRIAAALETAHAAALEAPPPAQCVTLRSALELAERLTRRGSTVLLASGLDDPGDHLETVLGSLARRVRLVVLAVRDALERTPPERDLPFADAEGAIVWGRLRASPALARPLFEACGAELVDIAADDPALRIGDAAR